MAEDPWELLARVGLSRSGGAFDALANPAATADLAAALAERLRPLGLDLLLVWEGLNSAVLGFAVALQLGLPVTVLSDDEGLVSSATPARAGRRAALVAPLAPDAAIARMAASYLENQGGALLVTATLLARPDHATSGAMLALAELAPEEAPSSGLPRPEPRGDRR